jgi:hypothetical protein
VKVKVEMGRETVEEARVVVVREMEGEGRAGAGREVVVREMEGEVREGEVKVAGVMVGVKEGREEEG